MAYTLKKRTFGFGGGDETQGPRPPTPTGPIAGGQEPARQPNPTGGGAGWVNLQDYLGVNQDAGRSMAGNLISRTGGAEARTAIDALPGQHQASLDEDKAADRDVRYGSLSAMPAYGDVALQADKAGQAAKGLTMFSPRATQLAEQGGNNYSAGMGRWDSFLSGATGAGDFKANADQYGGLTDYLSGKNTESGTAATAAQGQITGARGTAGSAKDARDALRAEQTRKMWQGAYDGFSVWDNKADAPITGRMDWKTFASMVPNDTDPTFGGITQLSGTLGHTWGNKGSGYIGEETYNKMHPAEIKELLRIHRLQYSDPEAFRNQSRDFALAMHTKYGG
jgi:hypothetical protein